MRTRIWHSDWKPRWLIRCVSAALLSFMDKQVDVCSGAAPFERSHFHSLTGTVIDINGARLGSRGGGPALNTGPPVADQP